MCSLLHISLRDGRSVWIVSALLLQLVQTSSHNIRIESLRIARARHQSATLQRQDTGVGDSQGPFLDELYEEVRPILLICSLNMENQTDLHLSITLPRRQECCLYTSSLDVPAKAAQTIVLFLMQRYRVRVITIYLRV
jgi:cohesin loading factor subunit SCC2